MHWFGKLKPRWLFHHDWKKNIINNTNYGEFAQFLDVSDSNNNDNIDNIIAMVGQPSPPKPVNLTFSVSKLNPGMFNATVNKNFTSETRINLKKNPSQNTTPKNSYWRGSLYRHKRDQRCLWEI
ncbi:hypothetical protein OlV1_164c [Ostreococcus lucimarinus virus 1]|uniref:hypothetical protein n=1 Tax=Ostreococcus lucimarinus virus 1 TaxID=880162 RepID=UPI0001EF4628|nr:hypothetical protein OlV1_164c [Ostreococcus lucimarinus virus 1]ADQ91540.1 hypothetical protein OlV1_164c [Ostreococcus lucimarinus virus 1]